MKKPSPQQALVLANIEHLRRYMNRTYKHYLENTGDRISNATVDSLFNADLIRAVGYVGPYMTFALTDKGKEALS